MCFGGGPEPAPTNPAPYSLDESQKAVSFEKTTPDGKTTKVPAPIDTPSPAPGGIMSAAQSSGLNVKGM